MNNLTHGELGWSLDLAVQRLAERQKDIEHLSAEIERLERELVIARGCDFASTRQDNDT